MLAGGIAATALPRVGHAQARPIRIGVLTDMAGVYAANTGPGSVAGAKLAIEDFSRLHPEVKVELVSADLQLKPDVAVAIAGDWLDNQGVDLITDVLLSSAAFAIGDMVKAKDKAAIFTGGASADITGAHCGPDHLHWVYDTWSMPHAVVTATVREGGDSWFFITADYALSAAPCRAMPPASSRPRRARSWVRRWRHFRAPRIFPSIWCRRGRAGPR